MTNNSTRAFPRSRHHYFDPANDTIFLRNLDRPRRDVHFFRSQVQGAGSIRHLSHPLSLIGPPPHRVWKAAIATLFNLDTITLLVGEKEKGWEKSKYVELQDVEEWFVDGRERKVDVDGVMLDIGDVGRYLSGEHFEKMIKEEVQGNWHFRHSVRLLFSLKTLVIVIGNVLLCTHSGSNAFLSDFRHISLVDEVLTAGLLVEWDEREGRSLEES